MKKKRSVGVTILAVLFIILGLINIYTLPKFILETKKDLKIYKDTIESVIAQNMYMRDSEREKFIKYMNSKQGEQILKEMNEYKFNILRRISKILFPVSQKLIWCVALILGMGLLFLKEPARKITIILAAIQMPLIIMVNYIIYIPYTHMMRIYMKYGFDKFIEGFDYKTTSSVLIGMCMTTAISVIFLSSCIIYFFTRPKVTEQFK